MKCRKCGKEAPVAFGYCKECAKKLGAKIEDKKLPTKGEIRRLVFQIEDKLELVEALYEKIRGIDN